MLPAPRLSKLNHLSSQESTRSIDQSDSSVAPKPPISSKSTRPPADARRSSKIFVSSKKKSFFSRFSEESAAATDETSDDTSVWKHEISPLIETLITAFESKRRILFFSFSCSSFLAGRHYDQFDRTARDLYDALAKYHFFRKKNSKKRGELLKTLFTFIECENAAVRFHVARLSLAVSRPTRPFVSRFPIVSLAFSFK